MRLTLAMIGCLTLALAPMNAMAAGRGEDRPSSSRKAAPPVFEADVQPFLAKYCYNCHGNGKKKGDLTLDTFKDGATALASPQVWEKVMTQLRSREMPPQNKPQPTLEERERLFHWVDLEVLKCDCDNPDPGRVTIRRLNRTEYNNTIRDLVGVDFHPAEDFPADDVGYGFDNIGDVLSLPPILLEKYLTAADKILSAAIVTEDVAARKQKKFPGDSLETNAGGGPFSDGWIILNKEGDAFLGYDFPIEGDYIFRVKSYAQQAGPELARMAILLGKDELKQFEVAATQDAPQEFEVRHHIAAGTNRVAVRYLNNYFNAKEPDPKKRDRNLLVQYIEVDGPIDAKPQPLPETHKRIFTRQPVKGRENEAAREVISNFSQRAFRRPVTKAEVDRLMKLYELGQQQGDSFEASVRVALQAVLVSPYFLFRGELQPEPDNPGAVHPVNEFALASRLSYFLWSTMPDEELFTLAAKGRLRRDLDAQIKRMLRDPKSDALVDNFAAQWLQTRLLNHAAPDLEEFPEFDAKMAGDMRKETDLFVRYIMKEDRSVLELIDADYSFINERLAGLYGIKDVKGEEFRRVSMKGTPRGGLLTQASILTITSNPTRTSPVKRGKWVLDNILGTPPPPPPPNVPLLDGAEKKKLTGTLRQRMEQHRADPACANCHARMDPIGFGFENFDAIGAWRAKDGDAPVDSSGELVTGETFKGPAELKRILMTAKRDEFVRCLTERMLTYALGRGLEYFDKCAVEEITSELKAKDHHFTALVRAVVESVPFQKRRGDGDRRTASRN